MVEKYEFIEVVCPNYHEGAYYFGGRRVNIKPEKCLSLTCRNYICPFNKNE